MKLRPFLCLALAVVGTGFAAAQDSASPSSIPTVLQITREYIKPYKANAAHDKTESAFVAAMSRAKFPAYYVALNSMSGKSRALFLTQYPTFAEWEKDNKIVDKTPSLAADLERAGMADGDLLDSLDSVVFTYDADLSYHPHADISHARYMELTVFHVRAGHTKDWMDLSKMYQDAIGKIIPSAHWAMFDLVYGGESGSYVAISARSSMAEIDEGMAAGKKLMDALGGPEAMEKFDKLYGDSVDSMRSELFSINPKQSYVNEAFIKADPDFWKPKAAAPKAQSAATVKPAAPAPAKPASR